MISFVGRVRYVLRFWPIERPFRWIFNRPLRDNPDLR